MMKKSERYDWLSFSFHTPPVEGEGWFYEVIDSLETVNPIAYDLLHREIPQRDNGRRPYALSYGNRFIRVYMSENNEWSLAEINGAGCELLTRLDLMRDVVDPVRERVTRIDVAVDIAVGEKNRVDEFVSAGYNPRFKTRSDVVSSTGRTHYIGSRTSERMCRVYQYNPPHPRAELLRIEFEVKGARAKQLAKLTQTDDVRSIAQGLIEAYDFRSPLIGQGWAGRTEFEPLRGKQRHNNTIAWIHKQVVPAVRRLVDEGVIEDLEEFVRETFLGEA